MLPSESASRNQEDLIECRKKLKALETILDSTNDIVLRCNDFFGYATADAITVDWLERGELLIDVVEKWGMDGLNAFCSMHQCCAPLQIYKTEKFDEAFKYLVNLNPFETNGLIV